MRTSGVAESGDHRKQGSAGCRGMGGASESGESEGAILQKEGNRK
jgi:hypothetical protein